MEGKLLKRFIISEIILTALFVLIVWCTNYVMQDVIWWKTMIVILLELVVILVIGALNIVQHLMKKNNNKFPNQGK